MRLKTVLAAFIVPLALASAFALAESSTLTGTVTDAMCGAQHMMSNTTAAKCTRECVKQGSGYALVVGSKVYTLKGHEADLNKFAGAKVTVTGKITNGTIAVESVKAAS